MPDEPTDFVDGLVTMAAAAIRGATGVGRAPLRGEPLDGSTARSTTPTASC